MSGRHGPRPILTHLLPALAVAACAYDSADRTVADILVSEWRTVLSPDAVDVGTVQAVEIGPAGHLYIADGANSRIGVLDPSDGTFRHFGGPGEGPGEFRFVNALSVSREAVLAFDVGTSRVSSFSHDGAFLGVLGTHAFAMGPASLNAAGDVLSPTLGSGGALARLQTIGRDSALPIGELVVEPSGRSISELQAEAAREGTWIDDHRNTVVPVVGADGRSWLVLPVEGEVRAFDASGRLQWTRALPGAAVELALARYIGRITDPETADRLWAPQVVSDARIVGDELWIAFPEIDSGQAGALALDASTGETRKVIRFPTSGPVIVVPDPARGMLFAAWPVEGRIDQADLPR